MEIQEKLLAGHYRYPSLTPENKLVVPVIPSTPGKAILSKAGEDVILSWEKQEKNSLFVVYRFNKILPLWFFGSPLIRVCDAAHIISVTSYQKLLLSAAPGYHPARYKYVLTALSPSHKESKAIRFKKEKR